MGWTVLTRWTQRFRAQPDLRDEIKDLKGDIRALSTQRSGHNGRTTLNQR